MEAGVATYKHPTDLPSQSHLTGDVDRDGEEAHRSRFVHINTRRRISSFYFSAYIPLDLRARKLFFTGSARENRKIYELITPGVVGRSFHLVGSLRVCVRSDVSVLRSRWLVLSWPTDATPCRPDLDTTLHPR